MKVLISGSTGLIGSALVTLLTDTGHDVVRLVRSAPKDRMDRKSTGIQNQNALIPSV